MQGRTQNWEANVHTKHAIHNLHMKYNTNLANLYNCKIFLTNTTIKLGFFKDFRVTIALTLGSIIAPMDIKEYKFKPNI